MKKFSISSIVIGAATTLASFTALGGNNTAYDFDCTPDLHVEGRFLKDVSGNTVNLHGVMDTPNRYFNGWRWQGWEPGYDVGDVKDCLPYFTKMFDAITDTEQGSWCNIFRLHLDPCWTNNPNKSSDGEADISAFDKSRLSTFLDTLFNNIAKDAHEHGMYVVMRPPGVCPQVINVGGDYYKYLMTVWDVVSRNKFVQENSGWLSLELANEPIQCYNEWGQNSDNALHDFFQPIVDMIRDNGFKGIIWIPGTGYQSNYTSYAKYPITGDNIGYAVHCYPGWYGTDDNSYNHDNCIKQFKASVPVWATNPLLISEIDWSPGEIVYENGQPKKKYDGNYETVNYGTWGTASTSKWGKAVKAAFDACGNVSMTLTHPSDYYNIDKYLEEGIFEPAFLDKPMPEEASGVACVKWYAEYAKQDFPICNQEEKAPFGGKPVTIPGKIECENYDYGGEKVSYHDKDSDNKDGEYRNDGVDIGKNPDGGYHVGWNNTGDWLEYTINVSETANYELSFSSATEMSTAAFHIEIDGKQIGKSVSVKNTETYDNYQLQTAPFLCRLPQGEHVLRLVIDEEYFDIDYIEFTKSDDDDPFVEFYLDDTNITRGVAAVGLSKNNPCKFLGNITTRGQINYDNVEFTSLWNQITPENESKWESIEGEARGQFNWTSCDNIYNYCKSNGIAFKFHTLIWGSQYPKWMDNLSQTEQKKAIEEWFDAVAKRYPDLEYIDVVNEAIAGHAPAPYKNALGGDGASGYDWIVTAFKMARDRWPNAILIYNDFNTFQWQKTEYIDLLQRIIKAGAPVDAAGCQSHDLNDMGGEQFRSALEEIHTKTGLPIFISEYDICKNDDDVQLTRYKEQFPIMWEADYVAGITLWGYVFGTTWVEDDGVKGASGIIKDGKDRPAMTWLKEYMQTTEAKNATSPYCNKLSIATKFLATDFEQESKIQFATVIANASGTTNTKIYVNGEEFSQSSKSKFTTDWTPTEAGKYEIYAEVTDGNGDVSRSKITTINVHTKQMPYNGKPHTIPGLIQAEDYDLGDDGISYHDADPENRESAYRKDGVDIKGNTAEGYRLGWTQEGEWLEYTVDIQYAGDYEFHLRQSTDNNTSSFHFELDDKAITPTISTINTGDWDSFQVVSGKLTLPSGEHILKLVIDGSYFDIDWIEFVSLTNSQIITLTKGWNLISINLLPSDNSIEGLFKGKDISEIKTDEQYWNDLQPSMFNSLTKLEVGKGYLIKANKDVSIIISGEPTDNKIPELKSGWNLIGNPLNTDQSPTDIFNKNNDCKLIRSLDAIWVPNGQKNTITKLQIGKGYFILK